jgi:hypothetical protein
VRRWKTILRDTAQDLARRDGFAGVGEAGRFPKSGGGAATSSGIGPLRCKR